MLGDAFAHGIDEVLRPLESQFCSEEAWIWLHVNEAGLKLQVKHASRKLREEVMAWLVGEGLWF